jgi:hypothetical protein
LVFFFFFSLVFFVSLLLFFNTHQNSFHGVLVVLEQPGDLGDVRGGERNVLLLLVVAPLLWRFGVGGVPDELSQIVLVVIEDFFEEGSVVLREPLLVPQVGGPNLRAAGHLFWEIFGEMQNFVTCTLCCLIVQCARSTVNDIPVGGILF